MKGKNKRDPNKFIIFTDGSSYNNGYANPDKPQHSASAFLTLCPTNKELTDVYVVMSGHNFNADQTISYAEIYAIYLAIKQFNKHMYIEGDKLTIYTDSEYAFKALTLWSKGWIKNSRDGVWYKSDGTPASYQTLLEKILDYMSKKYITLCHCSCGHVDVLGYETGTPKKIPYKNIEKCRTKFKKNNGYWITNQKAHNIIYFNNIVDQQAKLTLEKGMNGDFNIKRRKIIE